VFSALKKIGSIEALTSVILTVFHQFIFRFEKKRLYRSQKAIGATRKGAVEDVRQSVLSKLSCFRDIEAVQPRSTSLRPFCIF
jgi:hypothetical protein